MAGGAEDLLPEVREEIDREQVHRVHHEDPDEHGQRQGRHELAAGRVVHDALGLGVDHLHQDLHRGLEAAGHPGGRLARRLPQEEAVSTPSRIAQNSESQLKTEKSTTLAGFLFCQNVRWWTMYSPAVGPCPRQCFQQPCFFQLDFVLGRGANASAIQ
jgi:hypothetical protein